jgi:YesN/AraC family two-component response regulator
MRESDPCEKRIAMYKVVIADDEKLTLELIRNCVDWHAHDIQIVAAVQDADTALERCIAHQPDLLITDIQMEPVSGLELANRVRRALPSVCDVLPTGYDYFSYAREGIRIGVDDYLLKPIDEQELLECIQRIRKKAPAEPAGFTGKNSCGMMAMILEDIAQNLSDPQLSLVKLAKKYYVDPCYLSRAFKNQTGINFADYLHSMRIAHAKQLLAQSDMKAYEIAAAIGVEDRRYFSSFFKKHTGLTIRQYKKSQRSLQIRD